MGIWLRIPLVHPEALDPELNSNRNGTPEEYRQTGQDSSTVLGRGGEVIQAEKLDRGKPDKLPHHTEDPTVTVAKIGSSNNVATEGYVVDKEIGVAVKQGCGEAEGRATTGMGDVVIEDPWETWNTIRMMCDHKTG